MRKPAFSMHLCLNVADTKRAVRRVGAPGTVPKPSMTEGPSQGIATPKASATPERTHTHTHTSIQYPRICECSEPVAYNFQGWILILSTSEIGFGCMLYSFDGTGLYKTEAQD